jgi:hypothetical protein
MCVVNAYERELPVSPSDLNGSASNCFPHFFRVVMNAKKECDARPVWKSKLHAYAKPVQSGRTITCYICEITRDDGKVAAMVVSTVMSLSRETAAGRKWRNQ